MRISLALLFVLLSYSGVYAQAKMPPLDKSPMDMSYYPHNFPLLKIQEKITEPLVARVVYSRPQKSGRAIFGSLIEYGKVWRMGANEATEIEFFRDVKISSSKIKKGRYTLYCIPNPDNWTLIINKETDTWGSFKYDPKKDLLRVTVPVQKQTETTEEFAIVFDKALNGASLIIAWDDVKVTLPILF
ncbi:MAG TPA: DUF2911 domain-containing protein [Ferruginibacter sp.]|nr:hypothetical protein [Chitinophagaceae bacterium]HRI24083.1 DUF2911 domain-containing protein [Ferruginibacter sp.]